MPNWQAGDRLTQIAWHRYVFGGLKAESESRQAGETSDFSGFSHFFAKARTISCTTATGEL
jgi:hypothetical protein